MPKEIWQQLDHQTSRMKIPGGWIVLYRTWLNTSMVATMVVVPDPTYTWII